MSALGSNGKPGCGNQPAHCFTVQQLADKLGCSRVAVYNALHDTPADGRRVVRGHKLAADAWSISSLPEKLREELAGTAQRKGFRTILDYLQSDQTPWRPPVAIDQLAESYRQRAVQLRDVLAPLLADQHHLPTGELLSRGVLEYQRVFGHAIRPGRLQSLFDRTVERDRNQENWQRLDLYVDDQAYISQAPSKESLQLRGLHQPLDEIIANLENKADPTIEDRCWLLDESFRHFERITEDMPRSEVLRVKVSLLDYLRAAVPMLATSLAALRRMFDRRYRNWVAKGKTMSAIEDQRRSESGNFRRPDLLEDDLKIGKLAVRLNSNKSLAHRKLRKSGELSQDYCDYYHNYDERKNKSQVAKRTRDVIRGYVEIGVPYFQGEKQARLAAPYIQRDWSDAVPGDVITADDVTWNHYWWDLNPDGRPYITRGECLLFVDEFTDTPLIWSLHGLENFNPLEQLNTSRRKPSYNQINIRRGMLKVHDDFGLPDIGWRFEGGTWQARLIRGDKITGALHLHWRETQDNSGRPIYDPNNAKKLFHARTARGKGTLERAIRTLQENMRTDPAFVGFNERTEKMERMQDILRRVRAGQEHPGNLGIPSRSEMNQLIHDRLQEFMHEPQNGKRLRGASPWEMWQERITRKPLEKLSDNSRWVFASHHSRVVIRNGQINLRGLMYSNDATVDWNRHEVLAFFNVECPEVLVFSDLKRKEYRAVKAHVLPARNASREQFAAARHDLGAYKRRAKEIYHEVAHPLKSSIVRDDNHGEATEAIGRFTNEAVEEHKRLEREELSIEAKINRLSKKLGRKISDRAVAINAAQVLRGLEQELELTEGGE